MERDVRLIALDLDGTLLGPDRTVAPGDMDALERAAAAGIGIVPATGRLFDFMPEEVRRLPFLRYAITVNGAEVRDVLSGEAVVREEFPIPRALEVMDWLDGFDCVYDCYKDGMGRMTRSLRDRFGDYLPDPRSVPFFQSARVPVPDLKEDLLSSGGGVQKISVFFRDPAVRAEVLGAFPALFPALCVTSSFGFNAEINSAAATKGSALVRLCRHLGFGPEKAMAFGDGTNDVGMLRAAGIGVAMGNAVPEAKDAADYVTLNNASGGVRHAIDHLIFGKKRDPEGSLELVAGLEPATCALRVRCSTD